MEIRDILLFLHAEAPAGPAVRLAAALARREGARVTGCCLCADPAPSIADSYVIGYAGAADVLDRRESRLAAEAAPAEAEFRAALAEAGAEAAWLRPDPGEPPGQLALQARFADLAIVARGGACGPTARALAEAVVFGAGAPCLIAPRAAFDPELGRIVVAWNGSAPAKRALDDALPLLKAARSVEVVVAGEAAQWLEHCRPEAVAQRLARHGVESQVRRLGGDDDPAAEALAAACADADLLVMGAYSHSRSGEALLGGVTRAVLDDFPIPVLMAR